LGVGEQLNQHAPERPDELLRSNVAFYPQSEVYFTIKPRPNETSQILRMGPLFVRQPRLAKRGGVPVTVEMAQVVLFSRPAMPGLPFIKTSLH
jgi:hypothetical protein